jgi:hypothetical protein
MLLAIAPGKEGGAASVAAGSSLFAIVVVFGASTGTLNTWTGGVVVSFGCAALVFVFPAAF